MPHNPTSEMLLIQQHDAKDANVKYKAQKKTM